MKRAKWDNTYKAPVPISYGRVGVCLMKLEIGFKQIFHDLFFFFSQERELGDVVARMFHIKEAKQKKNVKI